MCFFFNPGPVWRVPIPNRYTAKAKFCFCKNNKRRIIGKSMTPKSKVPEVRYPNRRGHGPIGVTPTPHFQKEEEEEEEEEGAEMRTWSTCS